jgi:tetratricopeptide (TPR) repeat protein
MSQITVMNPFDTLELKPGASAEDIKMAYHRLAKQWHPDRFDGQEKVTAEARFREISEAFALLRDPSSRQKLEQQMGMPSPAVPDAPKLPPVERTAEDWFKEAKVEDEVGDSERALGLVQYAIRLDPKNPQYHLELAQMMERHGKDQRQIIKAYETAQQLNPNDADVAIRLGEHYQALGMQARSQRYFDSARGINPKHKYFKKADKKADPEKGTGTPETGGGLKDQLMTLFGRLTRKG